MGDREKLTIEKFLSYRVNNNILPDIFDEYKHNNRYFWRKQHISSLSSSDIVVQICNYINGNKVSEEKLLYDKMQELLNKLSDTNFNEIGNEIKELPYTKKKHIYKLCELIILKGVNEPYFCPMYAKLSSTLLPYYIHEQNDTNEKVFFRIILLMMCQNIFEILILNKEEKETVEYNKSISYSKLELSGLMKFIGELYNNDVINDVIINQCFSMIYKSLLEGKEYYDAINVFVQTFIKKMKKNNKSIFDKVKMDIYNLLNKKEIIFDNKEYKFKFPKIMYKFKVMEIEDYINDLG